MENIKTKLIDRGYIYIKNMVVINKETQKQN